MKPFETFDQEQPTFKLLELPAYADSYHLLYAELEGDVISLDDDWDGSEEDA